MNTRETFQSLPPQTADQASAWYSLRMRASGDNRHISGAEGIFMAGELNARASSFVERAFSHQRGTPDAVTLTIERISVSPLPLASLPLCTCSGKTQGDAAHALKMLLRHAGVGQSAIDSALADFILAGESHSGAALIDSTSGKRIDCTSGTRHEGDGGKNRTTVRVSKVGITVEAARTLTRQLAGLGLTHYRIPEALVLASKVLSCPGVVAELCMSDDPDYTTGYVTSRAFGYVRIPAMKQEGSLYGGRVIFLQEKVNMNETINYLQRAPAMVARISPCRGVMELDEIVGTAHS